jgi:hypothetical protein
MHVASRYAAQCKEHTASLISVSRGSQRASLPQHKPQFRMVQAHRVHRFCATMGLRDGRTCVKPLLESRDLLGGCHAFHSDAQESCASEHSLAMAPRKNRCVLAPSGSSCLISNTGRALNVQCVCGNVAMRAAAESSHSLHAHNFCTHVSGQRAATSV